MTRRQFSGSLLRGARTQRGLSRERLAVGAGISVSALTRYEQGRAAPGVNAAAALAEMLGVAVDQFLGDRSAGQSGG